MKPARAIHTGCIVHNSVTLCIINKESRKELLYELNNWFFDYFYANQHNIRSLPPLDDWIRSAENPRLWTVQFPNQEWSVKIWDEFLLK